MEEYLTTEEIAEMLKVNIVTVRRWIKSKRLDAIFLAKEYRIKRSDFEKFIEKGQGRK
jgi:excisionase family DNA binding protein